LGAEKAHSLKGVWCSRSQAPLVHGCPGLMKESRMPRERASASKG
jgi:hypothetical protein